MEDKYLPDHKYKVGDEFYSISLSGGRSSAFMLHRFLEANNGLPSNAVICFANTGKEHNSTLDFVHEISVNWGVPITWLEYEYKPDARGGRKDPKHCHKIVNHNSAARSGEPYWSMIMGRQKYLPNKVQRICTMELKVSTMRRYIQRDLGQQQHIAYIGIRYDEPKRWAKALLSEDCRNRFPMVTEKITKRDVLQFWKRQPFDLKTPDLYGNCDLCFLKGRRKLVEAIKKDPSRADWWVNAEKEVFKRNKRYLAKPQNARFHFDESYEQLKERALSEQTLWDGVMPLPVDEEIDCFCGD